MDDRSSEKSTSVWKSTVLDVIETILPRASDLGLRELEQYCVDTLEHDRDQRCVMLLKRHETYKLLSDRSTSKIGGGSDDIAGRKQREKDSMGSNQNFENHTFRFGRMDTDNEGSTRLNSGAVIDYGRFSARTVGGGGDGIGSPASGMSVKDSLPVKPKKRLSTIITEKISEVFRVSSGENDELRSYDYESVADEGVLQAPITDMCIVMKNDLPPPGFYRISRTPDLKRANLNMGNGGVALYLCIKKITPSGKRLAQSSDNGDSGQASDGGKDGVDASMPVVAVQIIFPDRGEFLPMGFTVARVSNARSPANLNHGVSGAERVYLCYKRDSSGNPLVDIQPFLPLSSGAAVGDATCPSGFHIVDCTLSGMTANLNSSTGGTRVFLSYFQRLRQLQPLRAIGRSTIGIEDNRSCTNRSNRQRGESGDSVSSNNSVGSRDNTDTGSPGGGTRGSDGGLDEESKAMKLYADESSEGGGEILPTITTVMGERGGGGENGDILESASNSASDNDDESDESDTGSDDDSNEGEVDRMVIFSHAYLRTSHRFSLDLKHAEGHALFRGRRSTGIAVVEEAGGQGFGKQEVYVGDSYGIPRDSSSCRSLLLLLTGLYTRSRAISHTAMYGLLVLLKSSTFFEDDFIEPPGPSALTFTHMAVEAVCDRLDLSDERESKYLILFLYLLAKRAKGHIPTATVSRIFKSLYHTIGNQSTNDDWITRGMAPYPCRTFDFDPPSSSADTHTREGGSFRVVDADTLLDSGSASSAGTLQRTVIDRLESLGSTIAPEGLTVLSVFTAMLASFALQVERLADTGDPNLDHLMRFLPRDDGTNSVLGREGESLNLVDEAPVPVRVASAGTLGNVGNISNISYSNDNDEGATCHHNSEDRGTYHSSKIVADPKIAFMRELVLNLVDEVTNNVEVASIVDTAKKVVSRSGLSASSSSFWSQANIISKMLFVQPQLQGTFMIILGACKMCWGGLRYEGFSKAGIPSHKTMKRASSPGRSPNVRDYGCKLMGLVLLGDMLSRCREVICSSVIMGYVVRRVVVPCLLHNMPAALQDHRLFSKVLAVLTALWRSWRVHLRIEIAFMVEQLFIAVMQGDGRPMFRMIVIQELVKWFDQPQLLVEMFVNYDIADSHHLGHWNLFNHLVRSISATAKKVGNCEDRGGANSEDGGEAGMTKASNGIGGGRGGNRRRTSSALSDDNDASGSDKDGEDGVRGGEGKKNEMAELCSYFSSQDHAYIGSITARNVHIQALEEVCRIAKTLMDASGHAFLIIQDKDFRERSLEAGAGWEDDGNDGNGASELHRDAGEIEGEEVVPEDMTIAQATTHAAIYPSICADIGRETGADNRGPAMLKTEYIDAPATPNGGAGSETAGIGARRDSSFSLVVKRSRVTSVAMRRASHREKGNILDEAVSLYRTKRHSIAKAIRFLISKAFISDTPQEIASFLRIYKQRFDPTAIGEYLGQEGLQYEQILFRYIRATSFAEMTVEPALRLFLTGCGFRLPGEGQKVSRFVDCFEKVYWADNSGTPQCPFRVSNTVFLVAYAIIMLNSDHHRANIGKRAKAKMSKEAFIKNLAGTDVDGDIDSGYLEEIFDSVEANAIEMDFSTGEGSAGSPGTDMRPQGNVGESLFGAFSKGGRTEKLKHRESKSNNSGDKGNTDGDRPYGLNPLLYTFEEAGLGSLNYHESAVERNDCFQESTCRELKECEDVLRAMRSFAFRFQLTGRETNISLDLVSFMYETVWVHFRAIAQSLLQRPSGDMFITFHALDLLSYVLTSSIFLGLQQEKQQLARLLLDFQTEYCVKKYSPSNSGSSDTGGSDRWSTPRSKPGLSQSWYKDVCDLTAADPRTLEVISKLHKLIVHLKDECQEISSYELTTNVASRIEGTRNILARNVYFVREGSLYKVSLRNGNQRQYRFFLFSDELIYGSVGLLGGQYRVHGQLPLHSMTVTDVDSDPTHCSMFIDHPHKSFTVVCPSPLMKNQWLRDIFQAISNCNLRAAMDTEMMEEQRKRSEEGRVHGQGKVQYSNARGPSSDPHHRGSGVGAGDFTIEHQAAFLRSVTLSPQRNDQYSDSATNTIVMGSSPPRRGGARDTHDAINMTTIKTISVSQGDDDHDSSTLSGMTMESDDSEDVEDLVAAKAAIERRNMTSASWGAAASTGTGKGLSPSQERAIQEAGRVGDWCQLCSDSSEDEDL